MTAKDIKDYRDRLTRKRESEIEVINQKYQRKFAALDVLLEDDDGEGAPVHRAKNGANTVEVKSTRDAIIEAIKAQSSLMGGMSGNFSSATLLEYIADKFHHISADSASMLSPILWKLNKDGFIEIVTQGSGRTPSIYRKTPKFTELMTSD